MAATACTDASPARRCPPFTPSTRRRESLPNDGLVAVRRLYTGDGAPPAGTRSRDRRRGRRCAWRHVRDKGENMKRNVMRVLLVAFLSPLAAAAAQRTFVSGTGSDSGACSLAAPCRTFQSAVNAVDPGGEVVRARFRGIWCHGPSPSPCRSSCRRGFTPRFRPFRECRCRSPAPVSK